MIRDIIKIEIDVIFGGDKKECNCYEPNVKSQAETKIACASMCCDTHNAKAYFFNGSGYEPCKIERRGKIGMPRAISVFYLGDDETVSGSS